MERLDDRTKRAIAIITIQLLFGLIGLFFHPMDKVLYVLLLPWAGFLLGLIGGIPFAGFLAYYWIFNSVILRMLWVGQYGLSTSPYTFLIWIIYQIYGLLLTVRSTTMVLPVPDPIDRKIQS